MFSTVVPINFVESIDGGFGLKTRGIPVTAVLLARSFGTKLMASSDINLEAPAG